MRRPVILGCLMLARVARTFREALECGSDRATALGVRGTVRIAQVEQASHAAARHDSTSLPKRWPCHRTPKCCARNGRHISLHAVWMTVMAVVILGAPLRAQVQEKITVERIIVDTRVTDDRGNPITGLKASDFRVRIDGKPAVVESSEWIPETAAARDLASIDNAIADINTSLDQPAPRGRLLIFFYQTDFARNSVRVSGQMQAVVNANDWLEWLDPDDRVAV